MTDESFSARHGHVQPKPIVLREELPEWARKVIFGILKKYTNDKVLSDTLTSILQPFKEYETSLISMMENPTDVEMTFLRLEYFHVYDVIESIHGALQYHDENHVDPVYDWNQNPTGEFTEEFRAEPFRLEMNRYFVYAGIGWELTQDSKIVSRGDENFTQAVAGAKSALIQTGRTIAAEHLHNAERALSERPKANTMGAVAGAASAVEALFHDLSGRPSGKLTLADYLKANPNLLHPALSKALSIIFGYASDEGARHGKEGTQPTQPGARFMVTTCAAICSLLVETNPES
jgi:hypothetical protein